MPIEDEPRAVTLSVRSGLKDWVKLRDKIYILLVKERAFELRTYL